MKIGSTDLSLAQAVISIGWDSILRWERERDSANYVFNPKTEFLIYCSAIPGEWGADKSAVFDDLIDSEDDCNVFQVSIEQECDGEYSEVWSGEFSSKDWKSDRTKKTIRVKASEANPFDCLKENWKEQQNPFGLTVIDARSTYDTYEMFEDVFIQYDLENPCPPPVPFDNFCYFDLVESAAPQIEAIVCGYLYHRFRHPGGCDGSTPTPPDDINPWTILDDNCPTDSEWWYCPEDARITHLYPNGRLFNDVLEYLVDQTGCGLTVVSNFFGINADATNPSNSVYTKSAAELQEIAVFQKSDIKRHDNSDPSKEPAWNMNLEDFWADIRDMFKLDWSIDGTTLRIEHVSYFQAGTGNDYTSAKYERVLEQDKSDVPAITRFKYRDDHASTYFKGQPITTYCGEGEKEIQLRLFSCDVNYLSKSDGLEDVGDDGFVLAVTEVISDDRYIINDNRPLSWTELHENYHKHDMAGAGTINGDDVTPLSIRPTRKQPAFRVKHCCGDTFNPGDLHATALGDGQAQSAEWSLAKETLLLEQKY